MHVKLRVICCRITFEREGVRQQAAVPATAHHGPTGGLGQIAIGQTYIPSHLDRESRRVRHHNPVTGFVSSRPQATVVSPRGDETQPDGTFRSHAEANEQAQQALQEQVQKAAEAVQSSGIVQSEGAIPATPPDKARVQQAWDSHYEAAAKDGKQAPADYSLPGTGSHASKPSSNTG